MKRIVQFITLILTSIALMVVVSYAWFINSEFVDPQISGYSESAYFGGGDGTDERPYIIKNPRHLYNLAWLQYLGYFNVPIDSTTGHCTSSDPNYFGYNKDYSDYQYEGKTMTQYSFVITNPDLDMTGWVLPPIGTNEQPFVGKLVGSANGTGGTVEISNLVTSNNFNDFGNKHPGNVTEGSRYVTGTGNAARLNFANVIGFIGAIGKTDYLNTDLGANEVAMANSSVTISSSANALYNITLKATTVKTETSKALIGAVAGYVNGTIANVGVRRPTLNVLSSQSLSGNTNVNISDYTVAGYATNDYTTAKTKRATTVYNPTTKYSHFNFNGMGDNNDWGGSIDMTSLYNRINSQINNDPLTTYTDAQIVYNNGSGKATKSRTISVDSYHEYASFDNGSGAYLTQSTAPAGGYDYLTALYKDVYTITIDGNQKQGFKIHDGNGNYLAYNKETNMIVNSNSSSNTIWLLGADNHLYTYNDEVYSTKIKRYLNGDNDLNNKLSTFGFTDWEWDSDYNTFKYVYESQTYYLKFFNNEWTVKKLFYISDNNGNYLGYDGTTIKNYNSLSSYCAWFFSNDGKISNSNGKFLGLNTGNLQLGDYNTEWIISDKSIYNSNYYIQYDSVLNNWVARRSQQMYITYNLDGVIHYLSFDYNNNNPRVIDTTNKNSATLWTFSNYNVANPNGTISNVYNNITYYLRNNNGSLLINTTSQNWSNDGDGLYQSGYYILFDKSTNSWVTSNQSRKFYIYQIVNGVKHYLSLEGADIVDKTTMSSATMWEFSTYSSSNPSGTIRGTSTNGTRYYLRYYNNLLTASTTSTTWSNGDLGINYNNLYIQYLNGKWICGYTGYIYQQQDDGSNKYLNTNNGTSLVSGEIDSSSSIWVFTDYNNGTAQGKIYTVHNGSIKYLYYNNGLTLNGSSSTTWTNDGYCIFNGSNLIHLSDWTSDGFYISNGSGHFLRATSTSAVGDTTSIATANVWYLNVRQQVYTYYNNTICYLRNYEGRGTGAYLTTSSDNSYIYTKDNNTLYYQYNSSYVYYLRFYNNSWTSYRNTSTNLTFIDNYFVSVAYNTAKKINLKLFKNDLLNNGNIIISEIVTNINRTYVDTYDYLSTHKTMPSKFNYIPLNTNSSNVVKDTNTGYIMSGGHSGASGSLTAVDIRVAGEATAYSTSSRLSASYSNHTITTVYTYNGSLTTINENNHSYQKYVASKESLQETLSYKSGNNYPNEEHIGGIHFIDSSINMNHMVVAPSVMINGNPYTNYEMPENSIDFQLKQKGYINFFATLYYPGSTSFFSLHQIIRDTNESSPTFNKILAINHITEIYKHQTDKSADYIYKYETAYNGHIFSDGSDSVPSGYSKVFDTSWIETPAFNNATTANGGDFEGQNTGGGYANNGLWMSKLFYFEIPVNKGEFALGSVSGRDGGYLLYLDIGANAASIDRTEITQKSVTTIDDYKYVNGIQILDSSNMNASVSYTYDYDSAVASISSSTSITGEYKPVVIERTGNSISFTHTGDSLLSMYKAENITLTSATLQAIAHDQTVRNVLRYIDWDRSTDYYYYTTVYNDGNSNTSYTVYRMNPKPADSLTPVLIADNTFTADQRKAAAYGLITIDGANHVPSAHRVDDFVNDFSFTPSNDEDILSYKFFVLTENKNTVTENIEMENSRITGTETVYNLDNNVSNVTITNGSLTLDDSALGYTQTEFTMEYLFKLATDVITVTSGENTTILVLTYNNINNTLVITINGTTVTAVNQQITVNAT